MKASWWSCLRASFRSPCLRGWALDCCFVSSAIEALKHGLLRKYYSWNVWFGQGFNPPHLHHRAVLSKFPLCLTGHTHSDMWGTKKGWADSCGTLTIAISEVQIHVGRAGTIPASGFPSGKQESRLTLRPFVSCIGWLPHHRVAPGENS